MLNDKYCHILLYVGKLKQNSKKKILNKCTVFAPGYSSLTLQKIIIRLLLKKKKKEMLLEKKEDIQCLRASEKYIQRITVLTAQHRKDS